MTNPSAQALTLPAAGAGVGIHLADCVLAWLAVFSVVVLFGTRLCLLSKKSYNRIVNSSP